MNRYSKISFFSSIKTNIAMCPDSAKRSRAFQLYQSNRRNQNNICEQPCVFTNMYFGPPVKVPTTQDLCYLKVKIFSHFQGHLRSW